MKIIFLIITISILGCGLFSNHLSFSYVARTFYGYGKSVAECSVVNINEEGNRIEPYFSTIKLESKTKEYFINSYLDNDYYYLLTYYEEENKLVQSFSLYFKKKINIFCVFEKESKYQITRKINYESQKE